MSSSKDCNICQSDNPSLCSFIHDDQMPPHEVDTKPDEELEKLQDKMWHWFADTPYSKLDKCKHCGQRHYQCTCIDTMYFISEKVQKLIQTEIAEAERRVLLNEYRKNRPWFEKMAAYADVKEDAMFEYDDRIANLEQLTDIEVSGEEK